MSGVGSRGPPSRTPSKVIDGIRLRESSFDPGDVVVHTIDGGVVSLVGELGNDGLMSACLEEICFKVTQKGPHYGDYRLKDSLLAGGQAANPLAAATAVQAVPQPSEDDLEPLTLRRNEATATWCLWSVMTRGPFLKRAWSTNLEDLRDSRVWSTLELCDDADAAKAEARRVVAMKERKYKENPWKPWDTAEHLWNWASVDHTRSGDDDDVDGVSPAPLDGDADGAAPAPAPASEPPTPLRRLEPPAAYRAAKRYRHIREDGVPIQYNGRLPSRPA